MTYRAALESKLPFRLHGEPDYLILNKEGTIVRLELKDEPVFVSYADRISDAWEVMSFKTGETIL